MIVDGSSSEMWRGFSLKFTSVKDTVFYTNSSMLNMDPKLMFPMIGCFQWTTRPNHLNFISKILKTYFFGEEIVSNSTEITDIALVKMLTGIMHGRGVIDVIQKYEGVKYVYLFDHRYIGGFTSARGGRESRFLGVSHADELPIMYQFSNTDGKISEEDYAIGDEMITRWVNFAYSGNPDEPYPINTSVFGAWRATSSPAIEFLRIRDQGVMEKNYFLEEYNFWRKIPFFSKFHQ